jgi:hypothetical protein
MRVPRASADGESQGIFSDGLLLYRIVERF